MSRKARIDMPGLLQHVVVRGIERQHIFRDDYPWSGHAVLIGNRELSGQMVDEVLMHFGKVPPATGQGRDISQSGVSRAVSRGERILLEDKWIKEKLDKILNENQKKRVRSLNHLRPLAPMPFT
ncbi:MAG: hypothetical protein AB1461_04650 [Thermodesulfobacteriota bacterium]